MYEKGVRKGLERVVHTHTHVIIGMSTHTVEEKAGYEEGGRGHASSA